MPSPSADERMNSADFDKVFRLPFAEAEKFFRDKLNIPTKAYDDLVGAAHIKAFASAGASQADLLADLRKMVDSAIAGGLNIREFRQQFPSLVERYGWQLKGGSAAWRSDLIWRTNIGNAYQAGRWQQFIAAGTTHLKYVHRDGVRNPRPTHVAMDGTVLPITDPFWSVNYPRNGWGCHCKAVAALSGEIQNAGPRPEGWETMADEGWRYNVGEEAATAEPARLLTDKLTKLPVDIGAAMFQAIQAPARKVVQESYADFIEKALAGNTGREYALLGSMSLADIGFLAEKNVIPESSGIVINDRLVGGKKALRHQEAGNGLSDEEWRALPECVLSPEAVYYDTTDGKILYVQKALAIDDERKIKIVVALDVYAAKLKKTINETSTVFKIDGNALEDTTRYERIR